MDLLACFERQALAFLRAAALAVTLAGCGADEGLIAGGSPSDPLQAEAVTFQVLDWDAAETSPGPRPDPGSGGGPRTIGPLPDATDDEGLVGAGGDDGDAMQDPGAGPSCDEAPRPTGCACDVAEDCATAFCVSVLGFSQCVDVCMDGCEDGFECVVVDQGADPQSLCMPARSRLCQPCAADADCAAGGDPGAACVDFGDEGSFCGAACADDGDCPATHACEEVLAAHGGLHTQCLPVAGECSCNYAGVTLGMETACTRANEFGACRGTRYCAEDGLSACDAPVPTPEACNGVDDDCDGAVDEDIPTQACLRSNAFGACDGTLRCMGGQLACDGPEPAGEVCDGLDNDCDGQIDEGFTDSDGDGASDCVDDDDDGDGVDDAGDNCPADANPDQADLDGDGLGDACDPDADGDGSPVPDDCAPLDAGVFPGAVERCDGVDEDCNGVTDDTAACDDGDDCTIDRCDQTTRRCHNEAGPGACDDHNPCTDDACIPGQGCVRTDVTGRACDDGDPCTMADHCEQGLCTGRDLPCNDGDPCTVDHCVAGACESSPGIDGAACDDGDACTLSDRCVQGACWGEALVCEDGDLCTVDRCAGGACVAEIMVGALCDDGDPCTFSDGCVATGGCAGTALDCDDGRPCTADRCEGGRCQSVNLQGSPCDDGDACTSGDACQQGACTGARVLCDDDNPCTSDSCDPAVGCVHQAFDGIACDDGDACTTADRCVAGSCGGVAMACDDGQPCTADRCVGGQCVADPTDGIGCDDGNPCTVTDRCASGRCAGTPMACDDGNPCTADACVDGACNHAAVGPVPCDDGDACTSDDRCGGITCAGTPQACTDGNPCTTDRCVGGACRFDAVAGLACDDGDPCTDTDRCQGGACRGDARRCDDGNPCTADSCAGGTCFGQALTGTPCDDGDPCTTGDRCDRGVCAGAQSFCDDGNPCTADRCVGGACSFTGVSVGACDDGDPCTSDDRCSDGACVGTQATCDDGDPCTVDSCSGGSCDHRFDPSASDLCDDCGNQCPFGRICVNGMCIRENCPGGWGDCDGRDDNGCEQNTRDDSNNCGQCFNRCDVFMASEQCRGGQCVIASCESGWRDCDGRDDNGCEIPVMWNPWHCGACGVECTGGTECVHGECR